MSPLISILSKKMEELWEYHLNMKDPFAESMPYYHLLYEAYVKEMYKKQGV